MAQGMKLIYILITIPWDAYCLFFLICKNGRGTWLVSCCIISSNSKYSKRPSLSTDHHIHNNEIFLYADTCLCVFMREGFRSIIPVWQVHVRRSLLENSNKNLIYFMVIIGVFTLLVPKIYHLIQGGERRPCLKAMRRLWPLARTGNRMARLRNDQCIRHWRQSTFLWTQCLVLVCGPCVLNI
jgi:hypothetical protein